MIIPATLRVLVVDDNAYARAICSTSLKKLGVGEVVEADGGAAAILELMTTPFNVVLMDWYMPDINGAGVIEVMRDARFGPASSTPIILMTAYASRDNLLRARSLGVGEILAKPFTTEQLGSVLGRTLSPQTVSDSAVFL